MNISNPMRTRRPPAPSGPPVAAVPVQRRNSAPEDGSRHFRPVLLVPLAIMLAGIWLYMSDRTTLALMLGVIALAVLALLMRTPMDGGAEASEVPSSTQSTISSNGDDVVVPKQSSKSKHPMPDKEARITACLTLIVALVIAWRFYGADETIAAGVTIALGLVVALVIGLPVNETALKDYAWVISATPAANTPRYILWRIWVRLGLYKYSYIPQPRAWGSYTKRSQEMYDFVEHHRKWSQTSIAVFTQKGGATKTTVATWLAVVLKLAHKMLTLAIDLDHGGGKVERRYRQPGPDSGPAWTVEEAMDVARRSNPCTVEDLIDHTWSDEHTGVMFFSAPKRPTPFTAGQVEQVAAMLKKLSHTVILDLPPGLPESVLGAVRASSIRLIPAKISSQEELEDVAGTLIQPDYALCAGYHQEGTGDNVHTVVEGTDHSVIIVLSDVRWAEFNTRTQHTMAQRFGVTPEQIVLIPRTRPLIRVVRVLVDSLNPKTRFALGWLSYQVTQLAIRLNQEKLAIAKTAIDPPAAPAD